VTPSHQILATPLLPCVKYAPAAAATGDDEDDDDENNSSKSGKSL